MTLALLLALAAAADPVDALPPHLRQIYEDGAAHEARGQLDAAALRYRVVAREDPGWHQAQLDLGRVLEALEDWGEAERTYAALPYDADAVEALGRLQLARGRPLDAVDTFRKLRDLSPERPGTLVLEARALAGPLPLEAAARLGEYLEREGIDLQGDGAVTATIEVLQALRSAGELAAANALMSDLLVRDPEAALGELRAELEIEQRARALADAADVALVPAQVERLRAAREAFAGGDAATARAALEALVIEQERSAVAWGTLSDLREAAGDVPGAVEAADRAERLDPRSAAWPAKLGDLLSRWYAGRFDADAVEAYRRALRRDGGDADLWVRSAVAERRAGGWRQSVLAWEQALALDPDGPHAAEARRAVAGQDLAEAETVSGPASPGRPAAVPPAAWLAFNRAVAWRERPHEEARALAELAVVRAQAPRFVGAIDLEATIRADLGELDAAIALYEESLRLEPDRGAVAGRLARLLARDGRAEEAAALRARAAALGDPDALWQRALSESEAGRWWRARATLARFFAHTTGGPDYDAAVELDAKLVRRIRAATIAAVAWAVGLVLLPLAIRSRRRSGASLAAFLAREPGAWRDVARILSAIRHEVLKHHASVLPAVAEALYERDPEPARWAAERLYGERGALERLDGYVRELVRLGAASGVRLNLRHRDPAMGPLLAAVDRLRRLERALRAGHGRKLAEQVQEVSLALNRDAYRALGRTVAGLCVLPVTERLLAEIYADAAAEFQPSGRDAAVPEVRIEVPAGPPLRVRMFRTDLADVVGNLVRNAIEASIACGADEVGLALGVDEDPITGLERVEVRVRDRSPRSLTTATLRGRYVARGLGLAVDLTSRAGGSIHVEPEPGWAKAVVVRLPVAEVPAEDDE